MALGDTSLRYAARNLFSVEFSEVLADVRALSRVPSYPWSATGGVMGKVFGHRLQRVARRREKLPVHKKECFLDFGRCLIWELCKGR